MNNETRKAIGSALHESTLAYATDKDKTIPAITKEYNCAGYVWRIEDTANKVICSTGTLFSIATDRHIKRKQLKLTKMGQAVYNCLRMNIQEIKKHYPMHTFNPFVDLFVEAADRRHLFQLPQIAHCLSNDEIVDRVDALNGLVEALRKTGNSAKFKSAMASYARSFTENSKELNRYIDAHFKQTSRMLVLRMDLGYVKGQCWPSGIPGAVTYQEVNQHRIEFMTYVKAALPPESLCGFAWKLEYGLDKSFHYHLLLLLDGAKVREDVTIVRMLGEHWKTNVTNGSGLYWNCNGNKESYKSCGIGMVHFADTESRNGLKKAVLYMTKTDYYIKMIIPDKGRSFGKGNMPKPKSSMVGRPRIKLSS